MLNHFRVLGQKASLNHGYLKIKRDNSGNFFTNLWTNLKSELGKDKELGENITKFRKEATKLEQSDTIKAARKKYDKIQQETAKTGNVLNENIERLTKTFHKNIDQSEVLKQTKKIFGNVSDTAAKSVGRMGDMSLDLKDSNIYKNVSAGIKVVDDQLDSVTDPRLKVYASPETLKKRNDYSILVEKKYEEDEVTLGVVQHKDSKWANIWTKFKDDNLYINRLFDLKTKYDESDNAVIKSTRAVTEKFSEIVGGLFARTETSTVVNEIFQRDSNFTKEKFISQCRNIIIPNVLEALLHGNLEVLNDWCHEGIYTRLAYPIKEAYKNKYRFESKLLDISNIELVTAKKLNQGPVLVISFDAQVLQKVVDHNGKTVDGSDDTVNRMVNVWALCRENTISTSVDAWRIIDVSFNTNQQWL
ncbi:Mitochondrial import inner membrane translocase subunit TIM44 [Intoshia linei]|uniref:Mitochondrial import inner membrane translocase subunit TIM44 n=1 Tax=Intoshia linei TaxID=1819745 RepID=A0A177AYK9_9BILA|nr:Mitochondrial import inner membrane translocase subunit TIM44 [Intoshia linei]